MTQGRTIDGGLILVHLRKNDEPLVLLLDRLSPRTATFRSRLGLPPGRRLRLQLVLAPGTSVTVAGWLECYDDRREWGCLRLEEDPLAQDAASSLAS